MSAEGDLLAVLVRRTFDEILAATGNADLAMLSSDIVQRDGLAALGAPASILAALDAEIDALGDILRPSIPEVFEFPDQGGLGGLIPDISIPGLDGLRKWIAARLDELTAVVGRVAGAVKDAALAAVQATLPGILDVALKLTDLAEGAFSLLDDVIALPQELTMVLLEGLAEGLLAAANPLGDAIAGALGSTLTAFLSPLDKGVSLPETDGSPRLTLGRRAL